MSHVASVHRGRPASSRRVALTIAALILNGVVIALSLSESLGDVLLIACVGLLPAILFAFRHNETAFRRVAAVIAVGYLALAVVFIYPIGFVPAALCLLVAALARAR
jgi:hypothetical protein